MAVFKNNSVEIYYEEAGSGFPILVIPGGGLNARIPYLFNRTPFNPMDVLTDEFHCIAMDIRNANGSASKGPLEIDRPWDSHVDDQLRLMDYLGLEKFLVIGFCIGGPFIWKLLERAPKRVLAAVLATPSGFRPEQPDLFFNNNMSNWAPTLCQEQTDISMDMCRAFLGNMYGDPKFVFSVSRESVKRSTTPILVMPDDTDAHPYATAEESALLAPNAQMSFFPWKEPKDRVDMAIRHLRTFLRVHLLS